MSNVMCMPITTKPMNHTFSSQIDTHYEIENSKTKSRRNTYMGTQLVKYDVVKNCI